jgi:hypothetical protein
MKWHEIDNNMDISIFLYGCITLIKQDAGDQCVLHIIFCLKTRGWVKCFCGSCL